jgi:hypothetical protein
MMTDIFYALGDFFQWTFRYMEKLNMLPNKIFFAIGFIAMLIWLWQMVRYNKEAEQNGTLK